MDGPIPIAVVGMACRLPGNSDNPDKLWDMLSEGRSGWCEIPTDRWNKDSFYHPDPEAKEAINVKGLYFLKQDISDFDARFFNVHPHEAACLDPQQRILMETTYEALENAGLTLESIKGSDTSVHVGAYATDFERMGYKDVSRVSKLHMIGSGIAILSNRISYVFDLKGASSTVDTGCSGSMVALHEACLGLRAGESKIAIVAGTQLVLTPDQIIPMSQVGMTNPDGRCYVFDSRGSGYARGEGVVSMVLKRLDDALRDGDNVHAIIRNSGLNQDGKTAGISLPNPIAQANLMRLVYKNAGLDPKDTGYVEAHGTGTQAGDSAEISSIAQVFCAESGREGDLYVGSVKSNIGHLEASSGVAGLMKAILVLKNGMIPPNIDFIEPKPSLLLEERNVKIATKLTPLPTNGPVRVSVNSFGYGGTNAHIILETLDSYNKVHSASASTHIELNGSAESKSNGNHVADVPTKTNGSSETKTNGTNGAHTNGLSEAKSNGTNGTHVAEIAPEVIKSPETETNGSNGHHVPATNNESSEVKTNGSNGTKSAGIEVLNKLAASYSPELFVLSARSELSLQSMVENLDKWVLSQDDGSYFRNLSYTLSSRRTPMQYRFSTAAATHDDLIKSLQQKPRITKSVTTFRSVFLFTGQGAQWYAMGRELIASHTVFRESMLKSEKILKELGADWSLIEELSNDKKSSRVGQAEISQPSTTAIQIALVDFLKTLRVTPDIVLGHSSGEIAAAYAADALDQKTALEVSYHRGFMSQACARVISTKGAMMAVGLGEIEADKYIQQTRSGLVSVACINSPTSSTISGDESAIDELKVLLDEAQVFNRKLNIDTAYHSHHMKKVAAEYRQSIAHIKSQTPNPAVKFYSSVYVTEKTGDFDSEYWVENLVSPVRFGNALELICRKELSVASEPGEAVPLSLFTEIGPHSALAGPVRQTIKALEMPAFKSNYLPTLVRDVNSVVSLLDTAGKLFEFGYPVALDATLSLSGESNANAPRIVADLSPYVWDHSVKCNFLESNASKQHRFRPHAPHDLLGLRVSGTTNHEPAWRNLVGIDNLPWLRDHIVDGFIIYPGAAYLCMAIEAVRQINIDRNVPGTISRIKFKNVSFSKAIVIPERRPDGLTPDVEVMLTLRPGKSLTDRTWEGFRILSLSNEDVWSEHCSGSIMVEFSAKVDEVEGPREEDMMIENRLKQLQTMRDACDSQFEKAELYKTFAENGNVFGPTFSNVQRAYIGPNVGISEVTLPDIVKVMPAKFQQPHLIHPASFDAISHLGMPLYRRSAGSGPVMPTGMEDVTIYANKLSCTPGTKWIVASTLKTEGARSAMLDTVVFEELSDGSVMPIVQISGGALRGIGEAALDENTLPFHRKMSYRMKWQPDVDFISKDEIETTLDVVEEDVDAKAGDAIANTTAKKLPVREEMALYELAATIYIQAALGKTKDIQRESMKPHLQKLLTWMEKYDSETSQQLIGDMSEQDIALCLKNTCEAGVEGQMLTRIGENLPAILSGEEDSLSVMLEDDLLARFYSMGLIVPNYTQMVDYLKLLVFKHPHMKMLEIGAGTGGATLPLIQSLDREEGILFDRYCYTDISAGFFEQGKALLHQWIDRIDFKTLDISKDPLKQGFEEGTYDLIIASNVLHATSHLDETVANSRKLLKPGGRLILIELTRLTAHINIIFGTLAGWWASEDGRENCPLLSKDKWDATLKRQGFNGLEVAMPDHTGPTARSSMIVSKALGSAPEALLEAALPAVEIICQSQTDGYKSLTQELSTHLGNLGHQCSVRGWNSAPSDLSTIYIVLDDVIEPALIAPSEERFQQIVALVTKAKNVLWLGVQESSTDLHNPVKGLVNGLARVVRRENEGMRFVTVDVQQSITHSGSLIPVLSEIIAKSFSSAENLEKSDEDEYSFSNNQLLIPRIHADGKFDDWVRRAIYSQTMEIGLFHQADRPLKLEVETPGLLSSLRFVDDERPSKPMRPTDLELEAKAHGINFKDVFIAMGQMVPGVTMAGECSGIVRKVGSALVGKFNVGDRVCGIGAEPFSSHPRVDGNFSYQIPDAMTYQVGASIPVIFTTAYYCIEEVARLQAGQTILIHAASGGVGQAAIQLAQNIGAEIFCTVGSTAKRQQLIDHFNIPPSHIFSSRLRTFKQGILRLTNNKGVDCVLNSLSGESLHDSFAILAPLGTFVEIGKSDIYQKSEISMVPFDRNVTFAAVDLTVLGRLRPAEMRERLGKVLSLFEQGILKPVLPITTMQMGEIEEAFRLIQSRKHMGKVVVLCEKDTTVKLTLERPKRLQLLQDGTYVIAGGLGDLGRRTARFLAAHGAGHIVTLSRRKLEEQDQAAFEKELRSLGGELHIIKCDISSKEATQAAAAECLANLPPVKGVIHGGMVLRDHPFEQMSLEDYMTALKPKVQGTQNLEDAFGGCPLDFFIMLSSITSILGKTGQSNYAVGNAFQDALAQSKTNSKCNYISLNLGAVDGSDAITSLSIPQQEFMRQGSVLMSFDEVFKVMEYSMSSQATKDGLQQLILGFDRKSMEAVHDEYALANPVYGLIPYLEEKTEAKEQATVDVAKLMQQATSPEEIHAIVIRAICERFALFTANSLEDINPAASLDEFGIDSLVAIELKNWLVRTFQVAVQTSEIVDAASISSLAKTIASRSKIVNKEPEAPVQEVSAAEVEIAASSKPVVEEAVIEETTHGFHCCRAAKVLPKLPLVDFDTMFDDYLENSRMFQTEEEYASLRKDVAEFRKPGSIGRKLYNRLAEQARDPTIENWQEKYFFESIYLGRRMPLAPFTNFMAFHPIPKVQHTQAQRAAVIASIAFQCKQDLEADRWEPMAYLGTPNCTDLWQYIFNTARLPGVPLDRMAKFPGNDYTAVLHRGHIFKVMLTTGEENVTLEQLAKTFQSIVDREDDSESWTSILSADDRTSWAETREALIQLSDINKETISMVEAAAFLVCLDDTSPSDAEGRIKDMMMLEGFNRWVDKSISFVVCKNATSGLYVEHSAIDAMTLTKLQTALVEGIMSYEPPAQTNGHSNGNGHLAPPKEYVITTTPTIEERVLEVRQRFNTEITKAGYRDIILAEFGKDILLKHHLPIKGIYDLMCLLANYYFYGYNARSWEAISMSHYHKGRPDIVQVNTPLTAHFCTIAGDDSLPLSTRFQLMVEAAHDRNKVIKDGIMGHRYQRTLRAMELCAEEGEELPALFKNPLYESTVEPDQMFSNTDGLSPESCFIMQNPKRFWMTYFVTDNGAHFSVITGKEEVKQWADCLQRASLVMKAILDAA